MPGVAVSAPVSTIPRESNKPSAVASDRTMQHILEVDLITAGTLEL
jgi:hypothetical protein